MKISRFNFIATCCWLTLGGTAPLWNRKVRGVEIPLLQGTGAWQSRVLRLPKTDERPKPPVITSLRLHPGGEMLAAAGDDHMVRFWSLADFTVGAELKDHGDWVRSLDFSPDGSQLVTGGNDRRIVFWDVATRSKVGDSIPRTVAAHR